MLALITFYRFAHQVLRNYSILSKFMLIKVIIFLNVVYVCVCVYAYRWEGVRVFVCESFFCDDLLADWRVRAGLVGKPSRSTTWAHTRSWSPATPLRPSCVPRA